MQNFAPVTQLLLLFFPTPLLNKVLGDEAGDNAAIPTTSAELLDSIRLTPLRAISVRDFEKTAPK